MISSTEAVVKRTFFHTNFNIPWIIINYFVIKRSVSIKYIELQNNRYNPLKMD